MPSMPDTSTGEKTLAIIGSEDVVLGFKGLGFKTYSPRTAEELKEILGRIVREGCLICLLEEELYKTARGEIDSFKNLALPVFMPFSKDGSMPGLDGIVKNIRLRATGKL